MRRAPSHAFLGPAVLLYLLAAGNETQGRLDGYGVAVAIIAALLALTPLLCARHDGRSGAARVGGLGLLLAFALLPEAAPGALSLGIELAQALGAAGAAWLVLECAGLVPDALPRAKAIVRAARAAGVVSALLGVLAALPADIGWIASARLGAVPRWTLYATLLTALGLRLGRRRLGSSPEALSKNTWAALSLVPAGAVVVSPLALAALGYVWSADQLRVVSAGCAALLVLGHVLMIEPERDAGTGLTLRALAATTLALASGAGVARLLWRALPDTPAVHAGLGAGLALLGLLAQRGFAALAATWLAPGRGRLLAALEHGQAALVRCRDLDDLARIALGAAREASGDSGAEACLWLLDPPREYRIDAAGLPHATHAAAHVELHAAVQARAGEILMRTALEAQHVRTPGMRGLALALTERDALCAVPLAAHGELEGVLIVPRGVRRSHVALEELAALRRFGAQIASLLAVMSGEARARRRVDDVFGQAKGLQRELDETREARARLALEAEGARRAGNERAEAAVVAYGPAMRALLLQLGRAAKEQLSIVLWAEHGVQVAPLARLVHARSSRAQGPCVVLECSALRAEAQAAALLGGAAGEPGLLARASGGTLVVCDLPALAADAQQVLVAALSTRRVHVVATSRRSPDELCESGGLRAELLAAFSLQLRVPPLRERKEDVPSLLLLALDRAARVLGRATVGIDDEARALLLAHDFAGNEEELEAVVERAVERCDGPRVGLAQLVKLGLPPRQTGNPLDATLETVERRALRRALERAGGSRSEAARLLGIPRTTLIDKLRRHGLDQPAQRERVSERPG